MIVKWDINAIIQPLSLDEVEERMLSVFLRGMVRCKVNGSIYVKAI
ncbi:hypothetical protein OH685_12340 [Acinetobacter pittii]|nr:hypothetical protein OH685_12340 [Acinetobacter pittii]